MTSTIQQIHVLVDGDEIGITDLTIQTRMESATGKCRDTSEFKTFKNVSVGARIEILLKEIVIFVGTVETVNATACPDELVESHIYCNSK